MKTVGINLYGPLKFALGWFAFVFLFFLLGPIEWRIHNVVLFLFFLCAYHLAFAMGYDKAIRNFRVCRNVISEEKILKYLPCMIFLNLIFTVIATFYYTNISSPGALLERVMFGLAYSGDAYREALEEQASLGRSIFPSIHILLSPILIATYPLSLYFYKRISLLLKIIVFITLLFEISRWLALGTNKGIFDMVFYTISILLLRIYEGKSKFVINRKNIYKIVFAIIIIFVSISLFGNNISSRTGVTSESDLRGAVGYGGDMRYRENSIFTFLGNDQFKVTMRSLDSYVTQGYYAFSRAISEPFTSTYGVGHSSFFMANINPRAIRNTYQAKLEKYGIDRSVNWHSCYVWWANDVSFWGVILIMYIWGYYFGAIYKEIRLCHDPISIVIFSLFFIWLFYSSANNQLMSFPFQAMAFIILTGYWVFRNLVKS